MNDKEKEFRQSLRVDNTKIIEDFIRKERLKIVADKKLNNEQKRERIELLKEMQTEVDIVKRVEQTQEALRKKNEEAWEK